MGKLIVDIIEDNFSRKFSAAKELSVLLGMDSFTYMICDADKNVHILKSFALTAKGSISLLIKELEDILSTEKSLQPAFNSIALGIDNSYSALIPIPFYTEKQRNNYLEQLMPMDKAMSIFTNDLPQQKVKNVFAVHNALITFFEEHLPGFHILHFSTLFINALEQHAATAANAQLYVYIRQKSIRIVVFNKEKLLYANAFDYTTEKDVLYYVMLVLDQQNLDNNLTPVFILGQLLEASETYRLLHRYIQNIAFFEGKTNCSPGEKLSKRQPWFHFDMLSF